MRLSFLAVAALAMGACLLGQDAPKPAVDNADVAGTWQLSWQGVFGHRQGVLQIRQDGAQLSGTVQSEGESHPITGNVKNNEVAISFEPQPAMKLVFAGTIKGKKMSGTTPAGRAWAATRR